MAHSFLGKSAQEEKDIFKTIKSELLDVLQDESKSSEMRLKIAGEKSADFLNVKSIKNLDELMKMHKDQYHRTIGAFLLAAQDTHDPLMQLKICMSKIDITWGQRKLTIPS